MTSPLAGRIFDAHMHVDDVPSLGWSMSAADCIRRMDAAGVESAIIMSITDAPALNPAALELIAAACAEYPQRLHGFARLHPGYGDEAIKLLRTAVRELGFTGLKLHPVSTLSHPSGPDTVALVREAADLGIPVLFHCGDEPMTTPYQIAPLAAACPQAQIILGHMGGYYHVDDAIAAAEKYPNLYLETSAMPFPDKIHEAVRRIGAGRVIFGSDGPVCPPVLEVEKVRLANLTDPEAAQVLGGTIRQLLGRAK
jgi:predicted TIM-barrel fold metal-dependent hydrolase